jgi:hypothetical protein
MISIEIGDELKVLTNKKKSLPYFGWCGHRPDFGMKVCMSVSCGFTIGMIILLILNVKEFST